MHSVQFVSNWSSGIETYEPHQVGATAGSLISLADKFTARWPGESNLSQFKIPTNTSSFWKRHILHQIIHFGDRPLSGPIFPRHHHKAEERIAHKAPHEVALQANVTWELPCHETTLQNRWNQMDMIHMDFQNPKEHPHFCHFCWPWLNHHGTRWSLKPTTGEPQNGVVVFNRFNSISTLLHIEIPNFWSPDRWRDKTTRDPSHNLSRHGRCSGRWETVRFERAATRRMAWQRPHKMVEIVMSQWCWAFRMSRIGSSVFITTLRLKRPEIF